MTLTEADRATRRLVVDAVLALQGKIEPLSARADSADTELQALAKSVASVPKAPAAAKDALTGAVKAAGTLKTEAARLNRSILQLWGQVSGSPFLPTTTERDELTDLEHGFDTENGAFEKLVTATVPAIEKQLNDAGVPRLVIK